MKTWEVRIQLGKDGRFEGGTLNIMVVAESHKKAMERVEKHVHNCKYVLATRGSSDLTVVDFNLAIYGIAKILRVRGKELPEWRTVDIGVS